MQSAKEKQAPAADPVVETASPAGDEAETKAEQCEKVIRTSMLWSGGGALIPVPLLEVAAIYGAQVAMVRKMSQIYGHAFSEKRFKNLFYPLVGSVGVWPVAAGASASLLKLIPGVGHLAGYLSLPVLAGGVTYATGRVFLSHFEAGGTLLDFDPASMKEYYQTLFEEGKTVAVKSAKTDS